MTTAALAIRTETALAPPDAPPRQRKSKRTAFASQTKTTVEASQAELRAMLARAGASCIEMRHHETACGACIAFTLHGTPYAFAVPLPARPCLETFLAAGEPLEDWPGELYSYEARCRERWRAIVLWTKGALEMARLQQLAAREAAPAVRRLGR